MARKHNKGRVVRVRVEKTILGQNTKGEIWSSLVCLIFAECIKTVEV